MAYDDFAKAYDSEHGFSFDRKLQVFSGDSDPTAGAGIQAGLGSIYIQYGSGICRAWQKINTGATDWVWVGYKSYVINFTLAEEINNFSQWFFEGRSPGNDSDAKDSKRSGSNSGLQNSADCSPFIVPYNSTIIGASFLIKGAGVQNGSVTYPVEYAAGLRHLGFYDTGTLLDTITFDIPDRTGQGKYVGTWSVNNTDYQDETSLDIDVDAGDPLSLQFIHGSGASEVAVMRNVFITLFGVERR